MNNEQTDHFQDHRYSSQNKTQQGRPRSLSLKDELFMVLCFLRQDFFQSHIAHLFKVSQTSVSRILTTWLNFLYLKLGQLGLWASRSAIDATMPASFRDKFPQTRVIIDCTEIFCEMPSSLMLHAELYSNYKSHVTLKSLVGIAPSGALTFISQLYTGCISDKEIVRRSGFVGLPFDQGDVVMVDKGFTIEDILPLGVGLNIPPFLGQNSQMSKDNTIRTQSIAAERIHIERFINKIKNFHISLSPIFMTNAP